MEIGGYIEFEKYNGPMLHAEAIKLNSGRNALAYLIEVYCIKHIAMPKFMCDSCNEVLKRYGVTVHYYSVRSDFKPVEVNLREDEWLYLVNFYGQLSNTYIKKLGDKYGRIIADYAQSYFQKPVDGIPTLYTCRKFFGVADGAILYTDRQMERAIPQDESFDRMRFLLGRFERAASEFYSEYVKNNYCLGQEPVKKMSILTENLLRGIDYEIVKYKRTENFTYLHKYLGENNKLTLVIPSGAFMYPLYLKNGAEIRDLLLKERIYIPVLWPAVLELCNEQDPEYGMAKNILPLPVDQRYGKEELDYMIKKVLKYL